MSGDNVAAGFCACGCGLPIAPGRSFRRGHNQRVGPSTSERFWEKVNKNTGSGCWEWQASPAHKYGRFSVGGRDVGAHRWSYERAKGPIADGLQIDHLCRNTKCVNPDHLEAVTPRVNTLRSENTAAKHAAQTHCLRGHELTEDNVYRPPSRPSNRLCRECRRLWAATKRKKQRPTIHVPSIKSLRRGAERENQ